MELNTLVAKRALNTAQTKDFSDWAESLLIQGCASVNVAILAGFGLERLPDTIEVDGYFKKCIAELGLVLPEEQIAIFDYIKLLVCNISKGVIEPRTGLYELLISLDATDNEQLLYRIWDELSEDINSLGGYDRYLWNTGLSADNVDEFIVLVAQQFMQLSEMELPDDFFHLCACDECGYIGKPQLKRIDLPWLHEKLFRFIYGRSPTFQWICGKCGQAGLKNMFDYAGRKRYLESLGFFRLP
jgi:hypothetical protein